MSEDKPLTPKQRRFVEEYLVDFNGKQAAIRAGYAEKSAKEIAYENLTKPHIQKIIKDRRNRLSTDTGIQSQDIVQKLGRMAFSTAPEFFDITQQEWNQLSTKERMNKMIQKNRVQSRTLEILGKHHGVFEGSPDDGLTVVHNFMNLSGRPMDEFIQKQLENAKKQRDNE